MDKINIFIKKYGLILLIGIILYCIINKSSRNKITESMICDLDRSEFNNFFVNFKHLIEKYDLKTKELKLLKAIFNNKMFRNNGYNKDNKSLIEYIKVNNIEKRKDDFIGSVYELLNSNRMWDFNSNYEVSLNSKISQLRHIWLLDRLINDLACSMDKNEIEKIKTSLKKMFNDTPIKLCSQKELLNYCSAVSRNPKIGKLDMEELEEEMDKLKKGTIKDSKGGKPMKKFKLISIKTNVKKFGKGYYPSAMDKILIELLEEFEEKYSRKIDNYDRNDLVKLVTIYVPTLKKLINKNAETPDNDKNKKKIKKELNINKELFYLLKHQYKLVSIYNLINTLVKDPKDKKLAYKCCSDIKDTTNKCFDFAEYLKDSEPIIYGFNKYGYVKDKPCTPETKRDLFDLQTKTLEQRLGENKFWHNIDSKTKNKFYKNLKDILNYFTVKNIKGNLEKLTISNIITHLRNQNINLIFPNKFNTKNNNFNTKNNVINKAIKSIELSTAYATIKKIANTNGLDDSDFDFTTLGANIKKMKLAAIKLLEMRGLLLAFRANKGSINQTISRMLYLVPSEYNYHKIMIKGGILPRYHDIVLSKFMNIISDIDLIKIKDYSLSKNPSEVIKYIEKVFPSSKDLDTCSIYKPVLQRLRARRRISPREYIYYKQNLNKYCDSRDSFLNKNKPVLYKDIYGKIIETYKKKVKDYQQKDITIITIINKNNEIEIVNLNKNKLIEYTKVIIKDGKLISNKNLSSSGNTIDVTSISYKNNKEIIGKSKLLLEKDIEVEEEVEEEIESPIKYKKVKSLLGKTGINTLITDNNKNLVSLINNYFDFEK